PLATLDCILVSYTSTSSTYPSRPPAAAAAPPMVSTARSSLQGLRPADRLAPSLYGLAVRKLRVRLRAHTSSPRPSSVGISASPLKRCPDFVHATTIYRHYNTNFTHFEAGGCGLAAATGRPGAWQQGGGGARLAAAQVKCEVE